MKSVIKIVSICVLAFLSTGVNAATINGSFGITGALGTNAGLSDSLADVTEITLSTVYGTEGSTGDTSNVNMFSTGAGGSTESLSGALSGNTFFAVEGWSFSLTSLAVVDQKAGLLNLEGTGVLSGAGYDDTNATWTLSTTSLDSYSLEVAAVPVPAAVWLFGTGLLGLVGIARRKA